MPHINFKRRSSSPSENHIEQSQDIPNDVLHHAYRFFSDPTQEIRDVSKDWTSLKEYPFIWTNLVFRGCKTSTNTMCDILQNAPMLESLELIRVPRVETVLRHLCRCRHQLKYLAIRFCHSGEDPERLVSIPEATLRHIIQCCPLLVSLDIEGSPFNGRVFYEELVHLRHLRSLRMGCSCLLRSRDIQTVAAACRGRLLHFSLLQCPEGPPRPVTIFVPPPPASRQDLKVEGRALRENRAPVTMGPLPLTSADCALVLRMLGPTLRVLELDIAGVDLWAIQGLLVHCTNLRCLSLLNAKNLSGDLVRQLSSTAPQLVHLVLRGSPLLGDEHLLGYLERDGRKDSEGSKGSLEGSEDVEGGKGSQDGLEEKEWWEWGFWSDHEDDDSDEEEDAVKNAAPKPEPGDVEAEGLSPRKTPPGGLITLDVGMCPFITDRLLFALAGSPAAAGGLRRLGLKGCQLVTEKGLDAVMAACTKLRYLDVSFVRGGQGPEQDWLDSVSDGGGGFPELTTLVVGWQKDRDDGGGRKDSLAKLGSDRQGLTIKRRLSRFSSRLVTIY